MTVWKVAYISSLDSDNYQIHIGNFLDDFYRSDASMQQEMVEREPEPYDSLPFPLLPFLSGMVHKLCNDYEVACPIWVHKDIYFLKEPFFALNARGNLRLVLLAESPVEFKMRNIFTSGNALFRV